MRRAPIALALASALLTAVVPLPSQAATEIVAVPGSFIATYATPVAVWTAGAPAPKLINLDIQGHDVVADDVRAPGSAPWCPAGGPTCPMFFTPLIGVGGMTDVVGLEHTPPGVYAFRCSPHSWMTGTLIVV